MSSKDAGGPVPAAAAAVATAAAEPEGYNYALIQDVLDPATREQALVGLSKKRETFDDLAPILWNSFGIGA